MYYAHYLFFLSAETRYTGLIAQNPYSPNLIWAYLGSSIDKAQQVSQCRIQSCCVVVRVGILNLKLDVTIFKHKLSN